MATAKSDDDSDVSSHPLAENRPGVYVQVVSPRRRKKSRGTDGVENASRADPAPATAPLTPSVDEASASRDEQESVDAQGAQRGARADAPLADSGPGLAPAGTADRPASGGSHLDRRASGNSRAEPRASGASRGEPRASVVTSEEAEDAGRESGERPVDFESQRPASSASDNTNHRADVIQVNIPPPPRLPSFSRAEHELARTEHQIETDPPLMHSASLLDAPHSLRPDSMPAARPSVALFALVAIFSAIIVSAGVVALRELTKGEPPRAALPVLQSPSPGQAESEPREARAAIAPAEARPTTAPSATRLSVAPSLADDARGAVEQTRPAAHEARPVRGRAAAAVPRSSLSRARAQARLVRGSVSAGVQATPDAVEPPSEPSVTSEPERSEERLPDPDEPLELPINPYR